MCAPEYVCVAGNISGQHGEKLPAGKSLEGRRCGRQGWGVQIQAP